jgi:hypothetical protein
LLQRRAVPFQRKPGQFFQLGRRFVRLVSPHRPEYFPTGRNKTSPGHGCPAIPALKGLLRNRDTCRAPFPDSAGVCRRPGPARIRQVTILETPLPLLA